MSGSGKRFHLQLHQAMGGEADHLAQQVAWELFSKSVQRFMISSVIGGSSNQVGIAIRPYRRMIDDRPQAARSLQRAMDCALARVLLRRVTALPGTRPFRRQRLPSRPFVALALDESMIYTKFAPPGTKPRP
jgi:hypothetical protein